MDFMKLLKSIEELLYELISWVVFYPLTMWRIIRHPASMMAYAQSELVEAEDEQFDDAVSPPILLVLTLVLLHLVEAAVNHAWSLALPTLLQDDRNLLILRAVSFSLFPLLFAAAGLRIGGSRMTRKTLKPAFYSQSYVAVPFVLVASIGFQMISQRLAPMLHGVGYACLLASVGWYLGTQIVWLARVIHTSRPRALIIAMTLFLAACVLLVLVVLAVALLAAQQPPAVVPPA